MDSSANKLFCTNCELDGENKEATDFCSECEEYLCSTCASNHGRRKATRKHVLVQMTHLKALPSFVLSIKTTCEEHDENLEYYCLNHEIPFCVMCSINHKDCKEISSIHHVKEPNSSFFQETENKLNMVKDSIEKQEKEKSTALTCLRTREAEVRKRIKSVKDAVQELMDRWEREQMEKLDSLFTDKISKMEELVQNFAEQQAKLDEYKNGIGQVKQHGSDIQLFLSYREINKYVQERKNFLQKLTSLDQKEELGRNFVFTVNEEELLKNVSQNLGKIRLEETHVELVKETTENSCQSPIKNDSMKSNELLPNVAGSLASTNGKVVHFAESAADQIKEASPPAAGNRHSANGRSVHFAEPMQSNEMDHEIHRDGNIMLRKRLDVNLVKIAGDMKIFGCASTPDGNILLADKRNSRIVILESDGSHVGDVRLKYKPNNIAYRADTLYYTSYSGMAVGKINMKTLQVEKEVSFDSACEALAVTDRSLVVHLSDSNYTILDFDLKIIGRIPIKNKNCPYLSYCNGRIYFAFWKEDTVFCHNMSGNMLWKFKDKKLKSPCGVTTDSVGNVFVSGYESNNIMRISSNGEKRNLIDLKYSLRSPYSIFYNRETSRLLVTTKDSYKILEFDVDI